MRIIKEFKTICVLCVLTVIAVLLIINSHQTSEAITACIKVCTNSLIPSLFSFMVICTVVSESGAGLLLFKPLRLMLKRVIRLDSKLFTAFLLSQIGGYPVGIKLLNELVAYNKNYTEIANKILPCCYNSGPAFVVGIVGIGIYASVEAGVIIFISSLLTNMIFAAIFTRKQRLPTESENHKINLSGEVIRNSLFSSGKALYAVCLSMLLFNSALQLIKNSVPAELMQFLNYIAPMWEVTNIKTFSALLPLPVSSAFIAFGGLCVIFQLSTIASFKINIIRFVLIRLSASFITAVICFLFMKFFNYRSALPVSSINQTDISCSDPVVAFCFCAMTTILLCELYKSSTKKS